MGFFESLGRPGSLQILSRDRQKVLILKYIAGLSNGSIANIMNKQEDTLRGLQMRSLQALAKYMQEKDLL